MSQLTAEEREILFKLVQPLIEELQELKDLNAQRMVQWQGQGGLARELQDPSGPTLKRLEDFHRWLDARGIPARPISEFIQFPSAVKVEDLVTELCKLRDKHV